MTVKNFIGANLVLYFYTVIGWAQAAIASDASGPKLPQLDIETYASQIFWLIITFTVLYFLVAKIAMPRIAEVLEGRQERIEDDLDKAETLKKEAYLVRVEYEKALSSAREEAHEATRRAQEEIAKHGAEVEALANQKVANMLKDAEDRIEAARTEASSEKEAVTDTLEQNVAREIIGDTVKKLVGIDVSPEDVNEAIGLTLKGRVR